MTAGPCLSLETLLDREEHREALFGRRAGVARRLKSVSPAARALLAAVARDHLSGSGMQAAFLDSLLEPVRQCHWRMVLFLGTAWASSPPG